MRNRAGNFLVSRLMEFLTALGQDVRMIAGEFGESDLRGLFGMLGQRIRLPELRKLKSYREFEKGIEEQLTRLAIIE